MLAASNDEGLGPPQSKMKRRALSGNALRRETAAHQLREPPADRQAEPESDSARLGAELDERLEDTGERLWSDAWAAVANADDHFRGLYRRRQHDLRIRRRELHGILKQ